MSEVVIEPELVETIEQPEPAASLADHAAQFSPEARRKAAEAEAGAKDDKPADPLKPIRPVDQQRRADHGQFAEGRKPVKAKDAVARINELTGRAKTAEERLAAAETELAQLRRERAPRTEIAQAERKVERAETAAAPVTADANDPEPQEDDPKFAGDYAKYLRELTRWDARQERRQERAAEATAAEQRRTETAKTERLRTFGQRIDEARTVYGDDYEATLRWDVPWLHRDGTPIRGYEALDAFIQEDESGGHVLHYLRMHPEEVDALLQVPPLKQVGRLTLIGQRFASSAGSAGDTASARPVKTVVLPPKPPSAVRTEAQGQSIPALTGEASSTAEHARLFHKRK